MTLIHRISQEANTGKYKDLNGVEGKEELLDLGEHGGGSLTTATGFEAFHRRFNQSDTPIIAPIIGGCQAYVQNNIGRSNGRFGVRQTLYLYHLADMNRENAPLIWPEVVRYFREKSLDSATARRYASGSASIGTSDNRYYVKGNTVENKGRVGEITRPIRHMSLRQFLTRRC